VPPIQAFTFATLRIALKDMGTSSWVFNIVDRWDRVEKGIDWGVPVF
jgi:hypothetical protein